MADKLTGSRTPELNIEKCIENAGGNRYHAVLLAAQRARELAKENARSVKYVNTAVSALLEIQGEK